VSRSGVYCGPLRLLACEVSDRMNAEGLPCRLVTGQEVGFTWVVGMEIGSNWMDGLGLAFALL
jgi:hypothetical protein